MPFVRFSRDKRGYEHIYLVHAPQGRGRPGPAKVLYWYRTPPGVKVGREPFDEPVRRALEAEYPNLQFDWKRIVSTPMPPPETENWREKRRLMKEMRAARAEEEREARGSETAESSGPDTATGELAAEGATVEDVAVQAAPEEAFVVDGVRAESLQPQTSRSDGPGGQAGDQRRRRRRRGGRRRRRGGESAQPQPSDPTSEPKSEQYFEPTSDTSSESKAASPSESVSEAEPGRGQDPGDQE